MKRYPHLNKTWSTVHLIFIGLIIIQSLLVGIIMLKQHGMGEKILLAHARDMMQRLADGAIQHTSSHLKSAENTARISAGLVKSNLLSPEKSTELGLYFLELLKNSSAISGLFYGDNQGQFLYVTRQPSMDGYDYMTKCISIQGKQRSVEQIQRNPEFTILSRRNIEDDYDPRSRPWFAAFTQRKMFWTDPYIFFTSQNPGITVSVPSTNQSDALIGAFGIDIEISSLSEFLAHRKISANSFSFIVTDKGSIAAHSNIEAIKTFDKMGRPNLVNLTDLTEDKIIVALQSHINRMNSETLLKGVTLDFNVDGEKYIAVAQSFPPDNGAPWLMTVIAPENDFIGTLRKSKNKHLLRALAYSIAITLLIFMLAGRFLKPVRKLLQHAHFDPLTDLYNRRAFFEISENLLTNTKTQKYPICIAMIDVDNFKAVNDTHGHIVGDEILIAIAGRLHGALSDKDIVGRYGGEEFVVLLADATPEQGMSVCERLRIAIADTPIQSATGLLETTVSIGLAPVSNRKPNIEQALNRADQALIHAKNAGKNQVVLSRNKSNIS